MNVAASLREAPEELVECLDRAGSKRAAATAAVVIIPNEVENL
jgi:hypothetical protein